MRPVFRWLLPVLAVGVLSGCDGIKAKAPIVIGSGSENAVFYPAIEAFAKSKGETVQFVSKGSVDLAIDLSQGVGAPYDIAWVASSSVLDGIKGHAVKNQESVSVSPVMPIVKLSKAQSLGWTSKPLTNADFYQAVVDGKLKFGMTSASQSFSGQSAYLGMLSSLSGNPEVLTVEDVQAPALPEKVKAILSKVSRSSASSGNLKDFMVANVETYDAMVNYEGLAHEANAALLSAGKKDRFCALMPVDGVIVADHTIGYVDKGDKRKADFYKELVVYLKSPEFKAVLTASGRRSDKGLLVSETNAKHDPCWDTARPIKLVTMPTSDVVSRAVTLYQTALRKPSLTVYVADFSGSMRGTGESQIKASMHAVYDQGEAKKWSLQATAKDVNVFIPFSDRVWNSIVVKGADPKDFVRALGEIDALRADGGTQMYVAVNAAVDYLSTVPNLSQYSVSVIPMTDGRSDDEGFGPAIAGLTKLFKERGVAVYSILFADAVPSQLYGLARHQVGGNEELAAAFVCDGRKDLIGCFRKVRANN